jgi:hypothetical protein
MRHVELRRSRLDQAIETLLGVIRHVVRLRPIIDVEECGRRGRGVT